MYEKHFTEASPECKFTTDFRHHRLLATYFPRIPSNWLSTSRSYVPQGIRLQLASTHDKCDSVASRLKKKKQRTVGREKSVKNPLHIRIWVDRATRDQNALWCQSAYLLYAWDNLMVHTYAQEQRIICYVRCTVYMAGGQMCPRSEQHYKTYIHTPSRRIARCIRYANLTNFSGQQWKVAFATVKICIV